MWVGPAGGTLGGQSSESDDNRSEGDGESQATEFRERQRCEGSSRCKSPPSPTADAGLSPTSSVAGKTEEKKSDLW